MGYRIKGINDEESSCCCCGKKGLKRVVWLESEAGDVAHYGTTCAGLLMYGKKDRKHGERALNEAKAHEYAAKWTGVHGSSEAVLQKIAAGIRTHYCAATVVAGELLIGSEIEAWASN